MNVEDRPDIVAVIEHYGGTVPIRLGWTKTRCVAHDDRTPSASVNLDENLYRCFVCSIQGDALDLIQFIEGIGFVEAKSRAEAITGGRRSSGGGEPVAGPYLPVVKRNPRGNGSNRPPRSSGPYGSIYG